MTRYKQWLERLASYGPLTAIVVAGESFSYLQLLGEMKRWCHRLDDLGAQRGHVFAARCDYSFASVSMLLSILANRGVLALIPRDGDLNYFLGASHAQTVVEVDAGDEHRFSRIGGMPTESAVLDRLRTEDAGGFIIFTSGSTGFPKAAVHSIERFITRFEKPGRRFRTLAFSTMDHVAGLDTLFHTLNSGGTVVLTANRLPQQVIKVMENQRVEVLPTSPSFLRMLCASEGLDQADLSSLQIITYGAEPMDECTLAQVNRRFPKVEILQKYGSTELGAPRTTSRGNDSLWLRFRDRQIETKIVDGVLWVRSSSSIVGYLNAPLELDQEGWYCTGDMVQIDDGWMRFLGRQGDCVNVGGQKVYPTEVESVLRELTFLQDVLVQGEPHDLLGQIVAAQVIVAPGTGGIDVRKEIREHCRRRISMYKVPMKITIVKQIPVTERQKRQRAT